MRRAGLLPAPTPGTSSSQILHRCFFFLFKYVFLLPLCCLPTQATKPYGFLVLLAVISYTGVFVFKCVFLLPLCCLPAQATKPCGFLVLLAVRSYTGVALFKYESLLPLCCLPAQATKPMWFSGQKAGMWGMVAECCKLVNVNLGLGDKCHKTAAKGLQLCRCFRRPYSKTHDLRGICAWLAGWYGYSDERA